MQIKGINMPIGNTLEAKMRYRINKSKISAIISSDFYDLSDRDQVGRILRKFVKEEFLIKLGQGIFAKTKESRLTGKRVLEADFVTIAKQALKKLKIKIFSSQAEIDYNSGKSTQIPTGLRIAVNKRVSRTISYKGRTISYEKATI